MLALLPHVTAGLNALAVILLLTGFTLIRLRRHAAHRVVMTAAVGTSCLFLVAYLTYHFTAPVFVFRGGGLVRPLYYLLLVSHVVLALAVAPMVAVTVLRARAGALARHRALARWTLPVWLYVSITGIVVYVLLYHVYRPEA